MGGNVPPILFDNTLSQRFTIVSVQNLFDLRTRVEDFASDRRVGKYPTVTVVLQGAGT